MANEWHIEGLHVFVNGLHVLRGANASFAPGTITLMIGRNGAGKSTLLESMAGLRRSSQGTIVLGAEPLWNGKKPNRAVLLQTGIAVQQSASQWFLPTVEAEFRYTLKPYRHLHDAGAIEQAIASALRSVGLPADLLSRDPRILSGGQQKRLAIAMLIVSKPSWLLLDEPTAGLDKEGTLQLCEALQAHRAAGGGAVIVTHDLEALLPLADAVIAIEDGIATEAMAPEAWAEAQLIRAGIEAAGGEQARWAAGAAVQGSERNGAGAGEAARESEREEARAGAAARESERDGAGAGAAARESERDGAGAGAAAQGGASAHISASDAARSGTGAAARPRVLPLPLQAAAQLRAAGFAVPAGAPWALPQALAEALAPALTARRIAAAVAAGESAPAAGRHAAKAAPQPEPPHCAPARRHPAGPRHRSARLDPRAIILAYMVFASAVLLQQTWPGLLAATALASLFVWLPLRAAIAPWRRAIVLYAQMVAILVIIGGVSFAPFGFHLTAALNTGFNLSQLLVVMVLGLPMSALMTPLRLQRALEQTFGWLEHLRIPIAKLALTVALIFRFIPMLSSEWERFARIAQARGKLAAQPGKVPMRMMVAVLAPFLLAMLRDAEQMTEALEARGYGRIDRKPTRGLVVRWSRSDTYILLISIAVFLCLYVINRLFV
ncbi:ABC transporter related protein [Paenibacillus curdlanolyticus YK9]|uniref:ABC transporter related protein n=1 Tax=Paenibacillus curdlanolyticus YK9 TaxID=717606 RepID=E0I4D4_9BACL|nr:ATP-binding cassette domain-containing protein [Paenibacillus curdlanolyticus]EFM13148.1 ABC transporter related protein [Paenibacillus curdlanolyticus YK9]